MSKRSNAGGGQKSIHTDAEKEEVRGSFGYSDTFLYKFMYRYVKPYNQEIVKIFGLMIIFASVTAIGPLLLMITINRFATESTGQIFGIKFLDNIFNSLTDVLANVFPSVSEIWIQTAIIGIIYFVVQLMIFIIQREQTMRIATVGLQAELAMRLDMFEHLQELDMSYHDKNEVGRVMSRLTSDLTAIREMLGGQVIINIANMLTVIVVMIIVFTIDPILALVPAILIPIVFAIGMMSRKYTRPRRKATRRTNSIMMANIGESISGIKVTKGHNSEIHNINFFQELNDANKRATIHADNMNAIFFPILLSMSSLGVAFMVLVGGLRLIEGAITLGALVAFLNYNAILFRPVVLLGQFYQQLQDALTGAERVYALLDTETKVPYNNHLPELPPIKGDVVFNRLRFEYTPDDPVYEKFSLYVPAGKTVAFVGKTGAGKTTIINILSRLYTFQDGELFVDDTDILEVSKPSFINQIAAVPQDFFLFSSSVRENLKLGNPLASDEQIWDALDQVGLKEYIEDMKQRLDTPLQERGGRLSYGQRQLMIFAAVLLANPRILILDEATSSMDVFSELKIQKAIKLLLADRTAFIIAHRLSTIRDADTIVVIDDGNIVEQGTHEQLIDQQGHYYELVKNQIELATIN